MAIAAADATLVVSDHEQVLLAEALPTARVRVMPIRRALPPGPFPSFSERRGIMFVGGFRHPPNQDAVRWFLTEIWPRVREMGLTVPLTIVGADAPGYLVDDPAAEVRVVGHVADLGRVFNRCRLSVAPIRYGAGLKGKVIDSLCHRLPVVATPMATEGSGLEHDRHLLVAADAPSFAAAIVELHRNAELWERLAAAGSHFCRERFSINASERVLTEVLGALDLCGSPP